MPVEYTTRLTRVPTTEGLFRLSFMPIRRAAITLVVVGPAPVLPPDREFNEGELHAWLRPYKDAGSGYTVSSGLEAEGAPLLEAAEVEG